VNATGWTVWELNPGGSRFATPVQIGPGAQAASYAMGTGYFKGVKRPGCGVDHPPNPALRLKKEYSNTSNPLWSFVACSRVNFTFTFTFTFTFKFMLCEWHTKRSEGS